MSTILEKCNTINAQKQTKIIPENIKKGVEIFGVVGTANVSNAKITDARYLFYNGARLDYMNEILSLCDKPTSCQNMFSGCETINSFDLKKLDTSNVTSMSYMFHSCKALTTLDLSSFNTSNVTSMSYMFYNCPKLTTLNVSSFNTSNVTSMAHMFYGCKVLTILDLSNFNTSEVTDMSSMFNDCPSLVALDLSSFNTSNVTNASYMFSGCRDLTILDLSSFDMSKVNNISNMFSCKNLTTLNSFKNLGKGYTQKTTNYSNYKLDLSPCTKLTRESLMSVINNLYDLNLTYNVDNGGTLYIQQLVLGSTNLAKLTAEEIAIATNKGWTVS